MLTDTDQVALKLYQDAFATWLGAKRAFGFWKGRVALYAILRGLGIGRDDEVIMPGYTCVMAVNPIIYVGAKPVFVDIDPATYNIDPSRIEAAVTPKTRLIIAQHTYGYPVDMAAIMDIARRKGLLVVEDCCLALGSTCAGKRVGTFGTAAYFSFQWNKPYTTGLGGMAAINDAELGEKIERVCSEELVAPGAKELAMLRAQFGVYRAFIYPRTTALAQSAFRLLTRAGLVVGSSTPDEFRPTMQSDFFKGMGCMQARVGLRRLGRAEANLAHRRRMATLYDQLLSERGWPVVKPAPGCEPVLVRYPVRVADKEKAMATAAGHFVELGSWFESPLHPAETPLEPYGYHLGMCPEAERASRETVNLPLHPRADAATARRSVEFVAGIGPACAK